MSSWERLAAFEGGTVTALVTATAADDKGQVFAATAVGVFRSIDRGVTWRPLGEASAVPGVEVVAPSPRYADDGTLFVGARDGLYRWREDYPRWEHLLSDSRVLGLAVVPNPEVGAEPGSNEQTGLTLLAGTENDGILISHDGGRTWAGANPGLLDLTILALAVSPGFAQDGLAFAATPSGLYRTRNGGESWRAVDLDWDDVAIQCLVISPDFAEDRVILAGTEDHGLLRSDDAGRSWVQAPELVDRMVNSLVWPTGGHAVAATDAGLAHSDDSGASWKIVGDALGPVLSVAPEGGGILLAGLPGEGIARSADDGRTWSPANDGLAASLLVGLTLSPAFEQDQTIFSASLQRGISISTDGGQTWAARNEGLDDLTVYQIVAAGAADGEQVVFASTAAGLSLSRDAGASWAPALPDEPSTPVRVIAPAPTPGSTAGGIVAVLADGRLILSTDQGATWGALARPPVDQAEVIALALSPTDSADGTIYVVTAGPSRQDGSAARIVWRSTSRGRRWEPWLEEHGAGPVQLVALPPNRFGDTVVLGLGGRVLRPRQNAWEVTAGARRPVWDAVELSGQERPGQPPAIAGLVASPAYPRDRMLFAATSAGVYLSTDGGASFSAVACPVYPDPSCVGTSCGGAGRVGGGLGPTATVAVAPSPAYARDRLVYALGLGGTIWRRRDESAP